MNINFSPVDTHFIQAMIDGGYYKNPTELVCDAVRQLREQGTYGQDTRLMAALEEGKRDIREGRIVPYTSTFLEESEQRARENLKNGIKPDPDVCP